RGDTEARLMSVDRPLEAWWTPDQLSLVEDRSRVWRQARFEPSDMLLIRRAGEGSIGRQLLQGEGADANSEVIKNGWDHEHCALCWVTISVNPEDQHEGYTDGKDWICVACFQQYVAPRL